MASLDIVKLWVFPVSASRHDFSIKLDSGERSFRLFNTRRRCRRLRKGLRVCSSSKENGDYQARGEEPPESLFMKELKRRGMTPTSLLEDYEVDDDDDDDDIKYGKDTGRRSYWNPTSSIVDQSLLNQRERSLALNSEGLEGLIPRARVLLTIGATFFLGFWPLIIVTVGIFSALYLYFGADFIHDASKASTSTPPPYIDPYALLEDERLSEISPRVN